MKKLLTLILAFAITISTYSAEVIRGTTLTDGQQLFASDLHNLVDTATIGAGFYNDQQTSATLGTGYYFLILDPATQLYRRVTAATALYGNTNIYLNVSSATIPSYAQIVFFNPTNGTMSKTTISNALASLSPNIAVSQLSFGSTNGYALASWPGSFSGFQTNNHPMTVFWGTNGVPYQQSLSNLETLFAGDLGTNRSLSYIYNQTFFPWTVYQTNSVTNIYSLFTNFPITTYWKTNLVSLTNLPTITDNDTIPILSLNQGTNTTVSVGALGNYFLTNKIGSINFTNGAGNWRLLASRGASVTNFWTNTLPQRIEGVLRFGEIDNNGAASLIVSNVTSGLIEAQADTVTGAGSTGTRTNTINFILNPNDVIVVYTNSANVFLLTNFWKGL